MLGRNISLQIHMHHTCTHTYSFKHLEEASEYQLRSEKFLIQIAPQVTISLATTSHLSISAVWRKQCWPTLQGCSASFLC